jgi:hypothetical protein
MQNDDAALVGIMAIFSLMAVLVGLICAVVVIAAMWKLFTKAGKPGWAAIVPIYNVIVLLEIIDKPIWWIVLFFIPFVNIVAAIIMNIELAKKFGKDTIFAVGLILLPIIFLPILGFGSAQYQSYQKSSYY